MGIQYDSRVKSKPYFAYYYATDTKKKIKIGWYESRDEAQEAVENFMKQHPMLAREKPQKEFNRPTFSHGKPKQGYDPRSVFPPMVISRLETKKVEMQAPPADLKFGLWKKKEDKSNDNEPK